MDLYVIKQNGQYVKYNKNDQKYYLGYGTGDLATFPPEKVFIFKKNYYPDGNVELFTGVNGMKKIKSVGQLKEISNRLGLDPNKLQNATSAEEVVKGLDMEALTKKIKDNFGNLEDLKSQMPKEGEPMDINKLTKTITKVLQGPDKSS